ncbi:MAG TPA: hypothetical protein VEO54_07370 [Thermoanaerobaculia bacterium]|nr:hypothetical protein [Thermoanaerobaculia bacterium]
MAPGRYDLHFDLAGLTPSRLHITMQGRDVVLPAHALEVAGTRCTMTIKMCRDMPPVSLWDEPLCSELDEINALIEKNDLASLRARYLVTTSIPMRNHIAGALVRRGAADDAVWHELAGYAEVAVQHPEVDGGPPPAFEAWSQRRNVEPRMAWIVVQQAFALASDDPRSRPMLLEALDTGHRNLVFTALLDLATQQDETALPAITRALKQFPDPGYFEETLALFRLPAARALAQH